MINSEAFFSLQIVLSVLLVILVLLQTKGTGLGSTFGSSISSYSSRRGVEKVLMRVTAVVVALFLIISIVRLIL